MRLHVRNFRPRARIIRNIYSVGVPSIIMASIGSVMTFGMNKILIAFTPTATAVFGVYFKLQSFVFMPVFGLNNGMVPIVAYNYGAKKPQRITHTVKLSILYAVGIMFIGLLVFLLLPDKLWQFSTLRKYARHRHSGVAHHQRKLPVRRLRDCLFVDVPGARSRAFEPLGLVASSALCAFAGRVCVRPLFRA